MSLEFAKHLILPQYSVSEPLELQHLEKSSSVRQRKPRTTQQSFVRWRTPCMQHAFAAIMDVGISFGECDAELYYILLDCYTVNLGHSKVAAAIQEEEREVEESQKRMIVYGVWLVMSTEFRRNDRNQMTPHLRRCHRRHHHNSSSHNVVFEMIFLISIFLFLLLLASYEIQSTKRSTFFVHAFSSTIHNDIANAVHSHHRPNKDQHLPNVVIFGGSGYIGRRICQQLVESKGCNKIISVSKHGKPPSCYLGDDGDGSSWSNRVTWIQYDLEKAISDSLSMNEKDTMRERLVNQILQLRNDEEEYPIGEGEGHDHRIDVIISCIGNMDPDPKWRQLFGLGFDDEKLYRENGSYNEHILVDICKHILRRRDDDDGEEEMAAPSLRRPPKFIYLSVNYEVAKALEGPIEGYMDGRRHVESLASSIFGLENIVVVGLPILVFGGQRFPKLGALYRGIVDSPFTKQYVKSNDLLRNISSAPMEDWVEKMLLTSPPITVDAVATIVAYTTLGYITKGMVGTRKQGFYDTQGKPVTYEDVVYIDGTNEIERLIVEVTQNENTILPKIQSSPSMSPSSKLIPYQEGGLDSKLPYLYPIPVALTFMTIFWSIATQQFVQIADGVSTTTTQ